MTSLNTQPRAGQTRLVVWDRVCRHIDGLAVGSTVAALAERGVLTHLAENGRVTAGELFDRFDGNPGFLHVALRLLADQGWAVSSGEYGTERLAISLTPAGRAAAAQADAYRRACALGPLALRIATLCTQGSADDAAEREFAEALALARAEWRVDRALRPLGTRWQILAHLDGHLFAPVMAELARNSGFGPDRVRSFGGPGTARRLVLRLLAQAGWVEPGDDGLLTQEGRIAVECAPQYWYPVGYLPLLGDVPELLFGAPVQDRYALGPAPESHVDRELDIRFSGAVFAGECRDRFLEVTLPIFDREPLDAQPVAVVDTGCGDGTMLAEFCQAIRDQTLRGTYPDRHPLLAVGVEPSATARRIAAARLADAGIPHLMLDGDISDPEGLIRRLADHGIDADDVLHISKSVLHNRRHSGSSIGSPDNPVPEFAGAYAAPNGSSLTPREVADDLAGLLDRWRAVIRRHGMVVVEAHVMDPELTASLAGRSVHTTLDATHGYSCQYPITPEAFAWAARAAGLRSLTRQEIGAQSYGHVVMTIDHFVHQGGRRP